jgi:hypothetical protein
MQINTMLISALDKLLDSSPRESFRYIRTKVLPPEHLHEFSDEHPCVFVLSTGRTGSKTLAMLFASARNVYAYHEPKPKLYGLSKLMYENSDEIRNDPVKQEIMKQAFLTARQDKFEYSLASGRGYVETSPQTTFSAPVILQAVPQAKFIHLVRDPRDVVRSGMRRKWYAGHQADQTRILPRADSDTGQHWKDFDAFQKCLWLWNETNVWINDFFSTVDINKKLQVRSEDLFDGHEEALHKLFAFIGAPMPSKRKIMRTLVRKHNVQRSGEFMEASKWSKEMLSKLEEIVGKTAVELGYEITC